VNGIHSIAAANIQDTQGAIFYMFSDIPPSGMIAQPPPRHHIFFLPPMQHLPKLIDGN